MSRAAVCPGSFDPVTHGHVDVFTRAANVFEHVVVAVMDNPAKTYTFSHEQRMRFVTDAVAGLDNVTVASFSGLLVTFCQEQGITTVVKGLRAGADFAYEQQMAQMNAAVGDIETVFLPATPVHSFVSSTFVKQIAHGGGDVSMFVTPDVKAALTRLRHNAGQ
jgi:pantetheine-phosphate adenylyltransferase